MDLVLTHEQGTNQAESGEWRCGRRKSLFRPALRQPLLTATLGFPLLRFLADTGLFVVSPPLQFPEEPFARKLFLRDLEGFLDVVVENFDFHSSLFCAFPGDACKEFLPERPG